MRLTNEQLKSIYFGALTFEERKDGYLKSFQYNDEQMAYFEAESEFWYDRCMASSAKTLEFITETTAFSFEYNIVWTGSEDSIELAVDGLITDIRYVKDIDQEGMLSFDIPEGEKRVTVYLPADATMWIRNFDINGKVVPVVKNKKVLWLGDSITQGYGPLRSAYTYVSVANRLLDCDIINQGIGGYVYDSKSLMYMGYTPDIIIVALGTNQYGDESMEAVEDYYARLHEIYGDTSVICITPVWRCDTPDNGVKLRSFCDGIMDVCSSYNNISIIDGFGLVPHLPEYYLDGLHPNAAGAMTYGYKLAQAINLLGL